MNWLLIYLLFCDDEDEEALKVYRCQWDQSKLRFVSPGSKDITNKDVYYYILKVEELFGEDKDSLNHYAQGCPYVEPCTVNKALLVTGKNLEQFKEWMEEVSWKAIYKDLEEPYG